MTKMISATFPYEKANVISATFPHQKQRRRVLGREMAYVEVGEGDPIVLLQAIPPRRTSGVTCCRTCSR